MMKKKIITIIILTIMTTLSLWSNVYAETEGEVTLSATVLPRLTIDDFDFSEINPNAIAPSLSESGDVAGAATTSKRDNNTIKTFLNSLKSFILNIFGG